MRAMNGVGQDQNRLRENHSRNYLFPLVVDGLFFLIAALPVDLLGCRNRGLIAVSIAIAAGMLGIAASVKAVMAKAKGTKDSYRLILAAMVYALPACYIVLTAR